LVSELNFLAAHVDLSASIGTVESDLETHLAHSAKSCVVQNSGDLVATETKSIEGNPQFPFAVLSNSLRVPYLSTGSTIECNHQIFHDQIPVVPPVVTNSA
jgi:hypothetical protein